MGWVLSPAGGCAIVGSRWRPVDVHPTGPSAVRQARLVTDVFSLPGSFSGRWKLLLPVYLRGAGKVAAIRGHQHHDALRGTLGRESCNFLPGYAHTGKRARTSSVA
jgi:hypothetical protein